jgi:hypothetical protein
MTYGEQTAQRLMEEHAVITMAALDGNLDALKALLSLTAQTAYTDGMSVTANTLGFPL